MNNYDKWKSMYPDWDNWYWQFKNRITNAETLSKWIPVKEEEKADIDKCLKQFRMAVTPYYLSLIDPEAPADPVRKQCIPSKEEMLINPNDMADPLNESGDSVAPGLTHRYPNRNNDRKNCLK